MVNSPPRTSVWMAESDAGVPAVDLDHAETLAPLTAKPIAQAVRPVNRYQIVGLNLFLPLPFIRSNPFRSAWRGKIVVAYTAGPVRQRSMSQVIVEEWACCTTILRGG